MVILAILAESVFLLQMLDASLHHHVQHVQRKHTRTLSICPNMKKGFVVVFGFPASIKQPIDVQIFAVGHVPLFKLLLRSICLWIPSFEIRPFCCILMHFAYTCVFLAYCSFSRAARALPCGSGRLSIDKVLRRLQLLLQR